MLSADVDYVIYSGWTLYAIRDGSSVFSIDYGMDVALD